MVSFCVCYLIRCPGYEKWEPSFIWYLGIFHSKYYPIPSVLVLCHVPNTYQESTIHPMLIIFDGHGKSIYKI